MTTASETPEELPDRWNLGWGGRRVEQIRIDYRLVFLLGEDVELAVECSGTVLDGSHASGEAVRARIDPGAGEVAAALPLLFASVTSAVAFKNGSLQIVFGSGHELVVPPVDSFEAWTAVGPGASLWVSSPGGGLATWTT